ncbi:UNVERIFIED_CONTAM: hypothetical protein Sradi_4539800 [Sesamum radiatum]|uniref:Uncharacterized protein n=1 Tax=Sesamum radiatum TaxID=300843 RepID=A0AAW2N8Z8_SESRA
MQFSSASYMLSKIPSMILKKGDDIFSLLRSFPTGPRAPARRISISASAGMTASDPYTKLKGVSPVVKRGVVLYDHNTPGNASTHCPPTCVSFLLILEPRFD